MARGWGKSAEDVEQEAEERALKRRAAPRPDDSTEARERRERRETLRLSRARTLEQLERSTTRAHREMLQRTLRAVESEIETLNREGDDPPARSA